MREEEGREGERRALYLKKVGYSSVTSNDAIFQAGTVMALNRHSIATANASPCTTNNSIIDTAEMVRLRAKINNK